jgi:hypothetical protein
MPHSRPRRRRSRRPERPRLLAGGSILAAVGLFWGLQSALQLEQRQPQCQAVVQPKAVLSRRQLAQLLTIPEQDLREKVRAVVKEPYCRLPALQVRAGVVAEREAYPLEFDPKTWIVILYEENEYAGYQFSFR